MGKYCKRCDSYKDEKLFYRDKNRVDGLSFYCKECKAQVDREYYAENSDSIQLASSDWYYKNREKAKRRIGMRYSLNKGSINKGRKDYYLANRDKIIDKVLSYRNSLREQLFRLYGDSCCLCGYSNKVALSLDHIQNNGAYERLVFGGHDAVLREAVYNYDPTKYRVLCGSCQMLGHKEIVCKPNKHLYYTRLRDKIFELYGGMCCLCGECDRNKLTLDHILGGGTQEFKLHGPMSVYKKASEKYQPNVYRILCGNCQIVEYRSKANKSSNCMENSANV